MHCVTFEKPNLPQEHCDRQSLIDWAGELLKWRRAVYTPGSADTTTSACRLYTCTVGLLRGYTNQSEPTQLQWPGDECSWL